LAQRVLSKLEQSNGFLALHDKSEVNLHKYSRCLLKVRKILKAQ